MFTLKIKINEFLNKRYKKLKGQSRMDNPETLATFWYTGRTQKHNTENVEQHGPQEFLLLVGCLTSGVHLSHSRQVAHVYYQLFDSKMADGDQQWSVPELEYDLLRRNASTN